MLANRIQAVLPKIISASQSAFVKGRCIFDNILLMQEVVRGYHCDHGPPRCALKLDIMKACDSVDWDFVLDVMRFMEFPDLYILRVQACISSPSFSILINGELKGFFPGMRGLRHGDPISPYLFLLVMEAFSSILRYRIRQGGFSYHPKCAVINLSHLVFADDMLIFCGDEVGSFGVIKGVLKEFHFFSGLQPNLGKSACFFAGVDQERKLALRAILDIPEVSLPVKYLGVPLISTKLRYLNCLVLKDKMLQRVQCWSNKSLSYRGRCQLISSVLLSIQVYWSSIFIIPRKMMKEIEAILNAFLWNGVALKSVGIEVAWKSVSLNQKVVWV